MLDRSKKRPRDPNQLAYQIMLESTGQAPKFDPAEQTVDPTKNPHAVALGRLGGLKGDPKPENETARNLKSAVRMWSFERKAEGVHHAEKRSQRREDSLRTAPGRRGQKGRRHVPRDGRVAADVLHLASTICRVRGE